jgi:hypothetical protein
MRSRNDLTRSSAKRPWTEKSPELRVQGARVFLEPEAAALLDDKVLDASVEHNQVAFTIADNVEE